jgi:medium-chain acyl-[acyl-carrier-protein] hydrolase
MNSNKPNGVAWFTCLRPNPQASLRLFCFPYAGGGATVFHGWAEHLPANVEVHAAQLPGRGPRLCETPLTSIAAIVEQTLPEFRQRLDKPFALFGHSMGALIGFELARRLREEAAGQLIHFFAAGRRAPCLPNSDPPKHDLPDAEFLAELHRLKGTPKPALDNPELMQLMLPVLRADFAACETYTFVRQPPLNCPLTVIGGLQDEDVGRPYLDAWAELTSGPFSLRMLPGDHFFIHTSVQLLLQILYHELHSLAAAA